MTLFGGVLGGGQCRPCGLWQGSQQREAFFLIPGNGDKTSPLVLLGEGPGQEEEEQNLPFVGRAGQLLNRAILEADLDRSNLWITNSVRCRPLNAQGYNRPPKPTKLGFCRGWLDQEMAEVQPKVIVAMGASAAWAARHPQYPCPKTAWMD
jgi:uracil-DNA glycosylase